MIGKVRQFTLGNFRRRRLFFICSIVVLFVIALMPRQAQVVFENVGKPFASLLGVPLKAMAALEEGFQDWWNQYLALQGVYEQNIHLQKEVERLQGAISKLSEKAVASDRLTDLLNFHKQSQFQTVAARVIGRNPSNWHEAIILDKGEDDGIRVEMGVVTPVGVVGQVVKTSGSMSIVLLVTDLNIAVTGLIQRTRDEGIIQGSSNEFLRMRYIPPLALVQKGDSVLTSGLTGGFPRGLLVGQVAEIKEGEDGLFQLAYIDPAVNFSKLEEVLVILSIPSEIGLGIKVKDLNSPAHRQEIP